MIPGSKHHWRPTMPTKTPRVSVLTPIYNTNPTHLRECIESILNQTFTDFEFLILNDSPDNTEIEKIVLEYAKHDKRIKYSKNEKNMGITPSRNKLLGMARGEYLAIFDHDDISVPTRLEQEVAFLDKNPHIGVVSGWLQYFGTDNQLHKTPEYDDSIRLMLTDNCWIAHTAAMIRKSVLTDNNIEYEEFYSPAEDYRLWARLMDVTHFYNIQEILVQYRWDSNNTTVVQQDKMNRAWFSIRAEICDKHRFLHDEFIKTTYTHNSEVFGTRFRLRLFGKIPLLKIKNNWVYLFEFIPVCKLLWR
ncbi:MAG: glycosyltransferase [Proteobacteria bacterium]|nr:glycosyltransferase [Candidatus Enterousia onthequi]